MRQKHPAGGGRPQRHLSHPPRDERHEGDGGARHPARARGGRCHGAGEGLRGCANRRQRDHSSQRTARRPGTAHHETQLRFCGLHHRGPLVGLFPLGAHRLDARPAHGSLLPARHHPLCPLDVAHHPAHHHGLFCRAARPDSPAPLRPPHRRRHRGAHCLHAQHAYDCRHARGGGRARRVAHGGDAQPGLLDAPHAAHQQSRASHARLRDDGRDDRHWHRQDGDTHAKSDAHRRHPPLCPRPRPARVSRRAGGQFHRGTRLFRQGPPLGAGQPHRGCTPAVAQRRGRGLSDAARGGDGGRRTALLDRTEIYGHGGGVGRAGRSSRALRQGGAGDGACPLHHVRRCSRCARHAPARLSRSGHAHAGFCLLRASRGRPRHDRRAHRHARASSGRRGRHCRPCAGGCPGSSGRMLCCGHRNQDGDGRYSGHGLRNRSANRALDGTDARRRRHHRAGI